MKNFFVKHDLDIQSISSVFTNSALAMLENNSGFFAWLKQEISHLQGTHCFLHRHALASKTLLPKLKNVLDTSVKTINLSNFSSLHMFDDGSSEMVDDDESLIPSVCEEILDDLEILSKSFYEYFEKRELETSEKWIINSYFFNLAYM